MKDDDNNEVPEKEENPMESGSSRYEYMQKTVETVYTPPPQNE